MRRLQNGHSRAFNRAHRRDGPLFRGRYLSRHVVSDAYWFNVIRYIDHNPVAAGMVARPEDHPFGSAAAFASGATPTWLDRGPVEAYVTGWSRAQVLRPEDYRAAFGSPPPSPDLIERRLRHGTRGVDTLGRLLPREPGRTLDWMTWKAELADGTSPGEPICSPRTIDAVLAARATLEPEVRVRRCRVRVDAWPLMRVGLLRSAAALTLGEIARRVGSNPSTVHDRIRTHLETVRLDRAYAERAAAILDEALAIDWPARPESGVSGDEARIPETGTR